MRTAAYYTKVRRLCGSPSRQEPACDLPGPFQSRRNVRPKLWYNSVKKAVDSDRRQRKIHLVGAGGVGMAGLAVLLKAQGHDVSGCDLRRTPRTDWLEAQGVRVSVGHDPAHVAAADEVVVTPAVRPDCPERLAAAGRVRLRGDVLADLVSETPDSIAVCGSHGKTTTATWIAKLLLALGEDVSWAIGGETGDFPVAGVGKWRSGEVEKVGTPPPVPSSPLVVEADESDGTLARYRAGTLVVTNCDYDHPDHFKTRADYLACFDAAKRNARAVVDDPDALGPLAAPLGLDALNLAPHNRRNALMAAEVARRRGHPLDAISAALPSVVAHLPDRRFQPVAPGVYTDYAHHPAEMACAVAMARAACEGTLRVLFQPHRYSRTKAFLADFPAAFAGADEVVLCPTYAAFEDPVEGGGAADLYAACRESLHAEAQGRGNCRLSLARSCEEAWEHARNSMEKGDLTLLLGAGDIVGLVPRVQADLGGHKAETLCGRIGDAPLPVYDGRAASPMPPLPVKPRRRVWIGAGTNTWKSDLNLSVDYVKTRGPAGMPGAALVAAHPGLLPWMAGIPGTVGGWIKMNAGAFGHSVSEALEAVKVDGEWVAAEDCGFGYRTSAIAGEIQDFRLRERDQRDEKDRSDVQPADYLARRPKFPPGTFGSFFKNPPGGFAGRLLEAVGAKGLRVGGAFVWEGHANVIVRGEGATASDVLALAQILAARVRLRLGVKLEPEVCGVSTGCGA